MNGVLPARRDARREVTEMFGQIFLVTLLLILGLCVVLIYRGVFL